MLDDILAARAAMAICERLLDNPDDHDALDAARQLIDDNMPWVRWGRQLVDSWSFHHPADLDSLMDETLGAPACRGFRNHPQCKGVRYGSSKQR